MIGALALLGVSSVSQAFETVVIDPGHGGNDEGTSWHHVNEKDVTLGVARKLERILREKKIQTALTRHTDTYVSLDERAAVANLYHHSLLVSIHFNGSSAQNIGGFETYYFSESPTGRFIAEAIQDSLEESLPTRNRGVGSQNFAVLVRTVDCAVLVECGFLSNRFEAARFASPEGQEDLARALADAIIKMKPLINFDPPETELAKCSVYEKRFEEKEKKPVMASTTPKKSAPQKKPIKKKKASS